MIQRKHITVFITEDCQEFRTYVEAAGHQLDVAQDTLAELLKAAGIHPTIAGISAGKIIASQELRERLVSLIESVDIHLQDK